MNLKKHKQRIEIDLKKFKECYKMIDGPVKEVQAKKKEFLECPNIPETYNDDEYLDKCIEQIQRVAKTHKENTELTKEFFLRCMKYIGDF